MRYWLIIKKVFNDRIVLGTQLLLLLIGTYTSILVEDYQLWKLPVFFIGLLSWLILNNKTKHPIIWIVFLTLLVWDLYSAYFWVANHHFMLICAVLSTSLYMYHRRSEIFLKNIQILLVVVVLASSFQKLMSSQFTSGNFYYYMINQGSLFGVFFNIFPESLEVAKSNSDQILSLNNTNPNLRQCITLIDIFPNLGLISLIFAWVTVAVEFTVAIAMLWKPKSIWTHVLFIMMILGILCTSFETGFMALLAICGIFLCGNLKIRVLYVLIVLGCITMMVTKIGYH